MIAVIPYADALRIANDSRNGLGGSVWTSDPERGLEVARRVRTGAIGVNYYLPDPAASASGVTVGGMGREPVPKPHALPAVQVHLRLTSAPLTIRIVRLSDDRGVNLDLCRPPPTPLSDS